MRTKTAEPAYAFTDEDGDSLRLYGDPQQGLLLEVEHGGTEDVVQVSLTPEEQRKQARVLDPDTYLEHDVWGASLRERIGEAKELRLEIARLRAAAAEVGPDEGPERGRAPDPFHDAAERAALGLDPYDVCAEREGYEEGRPAPEPPDAPSEPDSPRVARARARTSLRWLRDYLAGLKSADGWASTALAKLEDIEAALVEPSAAAPQGAGPKDRSEPPPGYEIDGTDGRVGAFATMTPGAAQYGEYATREQAVAACWDHRDRITAAARAETERVWCERFDVALAKLEASFGEQVAAAREEGRREGRAEGEAERKALMSQCAQYNSQRAAMAAKLGAVGITMAQADYDAAAPSPEEAGPAPGKCSWGAKCQDGWLEPDDGYGFEPCPECNAVEQPASPEEAPPAPDDTCDQCGGDGYLSDNATMCLGCAGTGRARARVKPLAAPLPEPPRADLGAVPWVANWLRNGPAFAALQCADYDQPPGDDAPDIMHDEPEDVEALLVRLADMLDAGEWAPKPPAAPSAPQGAGPGSLLGLVNAHLEYQGPCGLADDDEPHCDHETCTYCALSRYSETARLAAPSAPQGGPDDGRCTSHYKGFRCVHSEHPNGDKHFAWVDRKPHKWDDAEGTTIGPWSLDAASPPHGEPAGPPVDTSRGTINCGDPDVADYVPASVHFGASGWADVDEMPPEAVHPTEAYVPKVGDQVVVAALAADYYDQPHDAAHRWVGQVGTLESHPAARPYYVRMDESHAVYASKVRPTSDEPLRAAMMETARRIADLTGDEPAPEHGVPGLTYRGGPVHRDAVAGLYKLQCESSLPLPLLLDGKQAFIERKADGYAVVPMESRRHASDEPGEVKP